MTQYDVVSYGIDFRHFAHLSFAISLFIPSSAAAAWRMASQGSRMPLVDSAKGQKCLNVAVDLKQCKIDAAAGGSSAKKFATTRTTWCPFGTLHRLVPTFKRPSRQATAVSFKATFSFRLCKLTTRKLKRQIYELDRKKFSPLWISVSDLSFIFKLSVISSWSLSSWKTSKRTCWNQNVTSWVLLIRKKEMLQR